jgi:hypothetical protein
MKHGFKPRRGSDGRMTPVDLVLRYFPRASRSFASDTILWGLTGYPGFWHIPRDGQTPVECLRKQLHDASTRDRRGFTLVQQMDEAWDVDMPPDE